MKLATLKTPGLRDGTLCLVNHALTLAVKVPDIAPTLQYALDNWFTIAPLLTERYDMLNNHPDKLAAFTFDEATCASPLPRAYQWLDGSAYLNHVRLVRQARGAEMPPSFLQDPLMYQGGSDTFLNPHDPIYAHSEKYGIDFEAEVAAITCDVPMGVTTEDAADAICLLVLVNDVSFRNLIPDELAKGFGFLQSKPSTAFSPIAVTPDELGNHWREGKLHLPLYSYFNGELFGWPDAGQDMNFSFWQLISHAAKTRALTAGTIIGSGTVSNEDKTRGSSCIAERRALEAIEYGAPKTSFMHYGDTIRIEMSSELHGNIFGKIEQVVRHCEEL